MTTEAATKVTMRKMGGSLGLTLPKELVEHLQTAEGEQLHAVKTEQGVLLTSYDPDFEETMEAFDVIRKKYRNAFRELAK